MKLIVGYNQQDRINEFLYKEMWEPIGFDESIRNELKVEGIEIPFVILDDEEILGCFLIVDSNDEFEIRHAAVASAYRQRGIGKLLWQAVYEFLLERKIQKLILYSRNTSLEFWKSIGFIEASNWLDHPSFGEHGIRFKKMEYSFIK